MDFTVTLQASKQAAILFIVLYLSVIIAILYSGIIVSIKLVLIGLVIQSGVTNFKRRISLKHPKSIIQLSYYQQSKRWVFTRQNGQKIRGVLQRETFYSGILHVISIKTSSKSLSVVILPDSVGKPHFYRLLGLLKGPWA